MIKLSNFMPGEFLTELAGIFLNQMAFQKIVAEECGFDCLRIWGMRLQNLTIPQRQQSLD